jgi:hypothetical protein
MVRLRNVDADLNVRESVEFVQIGLIIPEDFDLVEAYVGLPGNEAVRAYEWAEKRIWRGKELDAALVLRPRTKKVGSSPRTTCGGTKCLQDVG